MKTKKVLVVGDIFLDRYWFGAVERISPEASVPVLNYERSEERLGGAGNVASNISNLKVECGLLALTGDDEGGGRLEDILKENGVVSHLIKDKQAETIVKLRLLSQYNTQLVRLDFEKKIECGDAILKALESIIDSYDIVIFSDYLKGTLEKVSEMIALAKRKNKFVIVDPKVKDATIYSGADLLTPNLSEFQKLVGKVFIEDDSKKIEILARNLMKEAKIANLLITMSSKGMRLISDEASHHFGARAKKVFDVSGAGDTVVATIAVYLANGEDLPRAVEIANIAASIVVGKIGTSVVGIEELEHELRKENLDSAKEGNKWLSDEHLELMLSDIKKEGKRVVFTNGCFDIIHKGHINYLKQAKRYGDILIVGVNTDGSVRRLKGSERPINDLESRIAVLSALEMIDYIVSFDEDTPLDLINKVMPDVLVKGADYSLENVVGAAEVISNGGRVELVKFEEGFSTSETIKKLGICKDE